MEYKVNQKWHGIYNSGGVSVDTISTKDLPQKHMSLDKATDSEYYQIFNFDNTDQVKEGLVDLIESDKETGEIKSLDSDEKYELLTRVKNSDGSIRAIGYMPIAPPKDGGADPWDDEDSCGQDPYPAIGDEDNEEYPPEEEFDYPASGVKAENEDNKYPGKTDDCW